MLTRYYTFIKSYQNHFEKGEGTYSKTNKIFMFNFDQTILEFDNLFPDSLKTFFWGINTSSGNIFSDISIIIAFISPREQTVIVALSIRQTFRSPLSGKKELKFHGYLNTQELFSDE